MFQSILTTALRHFARHQVYSFLSVGGLVIGITTTILLFIWVNDELSYDREDPDNERVFMVLRTKQLLDGQYITGESTPMPFADYMKSEIPEVETICRTGSYERLLLSNGDKSSYAGGQFAEQSYFDVFNIPLLAGDKRNLLSGSQSIVISNRLARTLFEDGNALGKIISINKETEFKVTGIIDHPSNSNLSDEFYLPFALLAQQEPSDWKDSNVYTYVKLNSVDSKEIVEAKIKDKINLMTGKKDTSMFLFALTDWRLHWSSTVLLQPGGRIVYVIAFGIVAVFILVMACINFINLATARAAIRAREIGVRKMSGATRPVLIRQFMTESLLITFTAAIISVLLVYLSMPLFNSLTEKELSLHLSDPTIFIGLLIIIIFTGVLAGSYPAFLLSSLKPAIVLKGNLYAALTGTRLRKALVIFQFSLSVMMIFSAIVIRQQIGYIQNKNLGFDKDNLLYLETGQHENFPIEVFKTEALRNTNILNVSLGAASPMEINGLAEISWKTNSGVQTMNINNATCDYDYLPALGFEFVKGRNFSPAFASDSAAIIITETAAKQMGFDDPIGQTIDIGFEARIIGVIKDFHNADIHDAITPVFFYLGNDITFGRWKPIFVRYKPGTQPEVIDYLNSINKKLLPGIPLEYRFVDRDFEYQYRRETTIGTLSVFFTIIATIIACLGLFGLTLFSTQRRTKEIGVRKVLGASIKDVVFMLCKDFLRPIILSLLISLPVAYYVMSDFLKSYRFHTQINLLSFFSATFVLLIVALLTISYQSLRAAAKNPVDALKTE